MPRGCPGGWALLELTDALSLEATMQELFAGKYAVIATIQENSGKVIHLKFVKNKWKGCFYRLCFTYSDECSHGLS